MDKSEQAPGSAGERLPQPRQSKISAVLNGMGNGMMIGAIPFVIREFYNKVVKNGQYDRTTVGLAFATVAGAAIGAWYGGHEARNLSVYRDKIGEEMTRLEHKIERLESKTHTERAHDKTPATIER